MVNYEANYYAPVLCNARGHSGNVVQYYQVPKGSRGRHVKIIEVLVSPQLLANTSPSLNCTTPTYCPPVFSNLVQLTGNDSVYLLSKGHVLHTYIDNEGNEFSDRLIWRTPHYLQANDYMRYMPLSGRWKNVSFVVFHLMKNSRQTHSVSCVFWLSSV